jgi:hypothetical protein
MEQEPPIDYIRTWFAGGGILVRLYRKGDRFETSSSGPGVCTELLKSALKTEKIGNQTFLMVDALHTQRRTDIMDEEMAKHLTNDEAYPYPKLVDNPYENQRDIFPTCYRTYFAPKKFFNKSALDPTVLVNQDIWAISFVSYSEEALKIIKGKANPSGYLGHTQLYLEGRDRDNEYFARLIHLTKELSSSKLSINSSPKVDIKDVTEVFKHPSKKDELAVIRELPRTTFGCTKEGGRRLLRLVAAQSQDPSLCTLRPSKRRNNGGI